MFLSFKKIKKKQAAARSCTYDPAVQKPVLRCSICTGEQVAGFKDLSTGAFHDIMLIRNADDLQSFKREYGIADTEEIEKVY